MLFPGQKSEASKRRFFIFGVYFNSYGIFLFFINVCLCCVRFSFLSASEEIGWEEDGTLDLNECESVSQNVPSPLIDNI